MQAQQGSASSSTPEDARAGELLFFSEREDGRITHVGLSLGGGHMAHVALGRGGFSVEGFAPGRAKDSYVNQLRKRFRYARSVLEGATGTR
jgi:cell wall-associated NlpC family hydrolase